MRVVALFLVFGLFVNVHGASLDELIEALNTTDAIWLFNQSYYNSEAVNRTCVYWHLKNLTTSSYLFDNDYKQHGTYETDYNTTATLSEGSENAMMTIKYTNEGMKEATSVVYTLNSWFKDEKCFVLTRQPNETDEVLCELHLWGSQISGKHTSCEATYTSLCSKPGPEVFSEHDCM
uniref:Lipocalin n=1 Tax=Rhipicephalus appendiculatus TaxID=34631 RepID=A0A131YP37_RHIAP